MLIDIIIRTLIKKQLNADFAYALGSKVELFIKERTLKGLDKDNKPFKPYSNRPFALPAAAVPRYIIRTLKKQPLQYFRRNNITFVVVQGGYARYKALRYAKTNYDGTVNLSATGAMMRSFMTLRANNNQVVLGFNRLQSAVVYQYNVLRGRDMLGITRTDLQNLFNQLIK